MAADGPKVAALVAEVGRFYIRDRVMRREQDKMTKLLAAGTPSRPAVAGYLAAVRRYFEGFEREARRHLSDVDGRLARVSQLQFNLTAERGVAARRIEVTQGVLAKLAEVAEQ